VRVRLARPAFEDLAAILDYLAERSPQAAEGLASRLDQVLVRLAEQPGMGVRTDDPAVRRVVLRPYPYLAFYEASEAEVLILTIRHAARDPRTMPGAGPEGEAL
jgi:toxin ParE1/3/4